MAGGDEMAQALLKDSWLRVMVWDEQYGVLFSDWLVAALCFCWMLAWLVIHPVLKKVLKELEAEQRRVLNKWKAAERRRNGPRVESSPSRSPEPKSRGSVEIAHTVSNAVAQAVLEHAPSRQDLISAPSMGHQATGKSVTAAVSISSRATSRSTSTINTAEQLPPHLNSPGRIASAALFYRVKLHRDFTFCIMAVIAGMSFLIAVAASSDPLKELITSFSSNHQIVFSMAAGHFMASIIEDGISRRYGWLDAGYELEGAVLFPLNLCCQRHNTQLHLGRIMMQSVALFSYAYILTTRKMGGLGVQGLLFEVPTILDLNRRLGFSKDSPPPWLSNPASIRTHWRFLLALFALARGGATCLWIYTLVPGRGSDIARHHLQNIQRDMYLYHALAATVTLLNLRGFIFMVRIASADEERAQTCMVEEQNKASKTKHTFNKAGSSLSRFDSGNTESPVTRRSHTTALESLAS